MTRFALAAALALTLLASWPSAEEASTTLEGTAALATTAQRRKGEAQ